MIVLITGTPGSGKTLYAVSKIVELHELFPDRQIYSDIDGLQLDFVLPSPSDWRTTDTNSIIFYDEAQQHERFRSGSTSNRDEIVQALQVHRHTGHDIYFITQSPRFLNNFVLDLVGEHYHLHRPYGAKLASVYYWRSTQKSPQSVASQQRCENEFLFKYPKDLFKLYKSATQHNVKLKIPRKLWIIIASILIMCVFVYKMVFDDKTQNMIKGKVGSGTENTQTENKQNTQSTPITDLNIECRKSENINKSECVKWFDDLSKNNGSALDEKDNFEVSYNPEKPFDNDEIQQKIRYEVTSKPVFSGCMHSNGKYTGYTQQGTKIEVSQLDCEKLIKDNDRPFNYFKDQNQNQNMNAQTSQIQQTEKPMTAEQYAKYMQYLDSHANNQVDSRLQQNQFTVNGANSL